MNIAILLAGGKGTRMESTTPKQFIEINSNPLISYTLKTFDESEFIDEIVIVCIEEYIEKIKNIVEKYNILKAKNIVKNGSTRQESVYNALESIYIHTKKDDIALIHDSVRAIISKEDIKNCVIYTEKYNCTTLAEKNINTMVKSENFEIDEYLNREYIYNIQTPQSFRYDIIYNAHKYAIANGYNNMTDDTQIARLSNNKVRIIENTYPNPKLTTKKDFVMFEYYLNKKI